MSHLHMILQLTFILLFACLQGQAFLHPNALEVSGPQVTKQLLKLATFSDDLNPAVTRVVFTPNDVKARGQAPSSFDVTVPCTHYAGRT